jgi:diaminopimelate epimerase
MVYTPQLTYRSESCKQLDERIQSGAGIASLNVTVNIDAILPNRNEEVINQVAIAIAENANFVLLSDKSHYIIIIPCKLAVACYVDGVEQTMEVMNDMQQFQNRVKIAFAVYDKFYRIDRRIENRGNGNEPLPLHSDRKDLSDGEADKERSQASIT